MREYFPYHDKVTPVRETDHHLYAGNNGTNEFDI